MTPGVNDVRAARQRIGSYIRHTPLLESGRLSECAAARVSLKLESLQLTGSFKIRGALNALVQLPRGTAVVAASAGNHGRAIAYAAEKLGFAATVFTPRDAPRTKVDAIRRHGAGLDQESINYDEAEHRARAFSASHRAIFISPYNHPHVIAGAGTIALELMEAVPDADTFVVPVGGGGLISGIAIAVRESGAAVRIIGVEPEASPAFTVSLRAGRPVIIETRPTIADGLSGNLDPDTMTFAIVRKWVDDVVTVTEAELTAAIRELAAAEHLIAEGAGAAATAAVMAGKIRHSRHTVALLSGGNIDASRLAEVLASN